MSADFPFARNADIQAPPNTHIARIGASIRDKATLLSALATSLRFPAGFGQNWDALDDYMTDLSWLPPSVILLHEAAPHIARKELVTYLEILNGALDVAREDGRVLIIGFPERTRALTEAWMGVQT